MNKKIFLLSILPISLIILSCNGYIYPQFEKNPKAAPELIKFDLTMSHNTSKIWAPIRLFEISKQNMPESDEGLKIKSCIAQWAGTFLEETIENDLIHLEFEYKNTYKTNDPDLNVAMLEYIQALTNFTDFVAKKYKNSEFTTTTPTHQWESEILIVDENDSKDSVASKLYFAMDKYGGRRNHNLGPIASRLLNSSNEMTQPILIHNMKNLAINISGQKSLKDSDSIDYYFYQSNKEYLFNTDLCKK